MKYTKEQLAFVRKRKEMTRHKLAVAFNKKFGTEKTADAMKCLCTKYGWKSGRLPGREYRRTSSIFYTNRQLAFIGENKTMPRAELTAAFNKKFGTTKNKKAIKTLCKRMGWKTGRTGQFEKGHSPHNTGTKGVMKPNSGNFQNGNRPQNWKSIGSERFDAKDGYIIVKVAEPNVWMHKHVVVWEATHGPVVKGEVITFKDGNVRNVSLDNLIKITRRELLWLNQNGYAKTPPELKATLRMLAKINVKVFKLKTKQQ